MFDLEAAVADWKQSLTARESLSTDDVAELESHLRDQASALHSMGLSGEEAFLIARRRVGQPSELAAEFAKVRSSIRWVHRGKWMCIGILALIMIRSVGGLLFRIASLSGSLSEVDPMTQAIVYNTAEIAWSWLIVLGSLFVVLRHDALVDRIVQRLARIPKPILVGVPVATAPVLGLVISFGLYMTNGHEHTAFYLSWYAYNISLPILFLLAACVLRRFEQHRGLT